MAQGIKRRAVLVQKFSSGGERLAYLAFAACALVSEGWAFYYSMVKKTRYFSLVVVWRLLQKKTPPFLPKQT